MCWRRNSTRKALDYVRRAPRVNEWDPQPNPGAYTTGRLITKRHNRAGKTMKELQSAARPPLGWIWGDFYSPWQRKFPSEKHFNRDIHLRREYTPLSLIELQRLIDLGWIDAKYPIDLATLCGTHRVTVDPMVRQFGVQLTDVGADIFSARVNLEVQWASELAVSTIERLGGTITCAYFDPESLLAIADAQKWFESGKVVPKRQPPPADLIEFYSDASTRGYLASEEDLHRAREITAQKYGYTLPDMSGAGELLTMRKHKYQIFYGLQPGWLVNLADRCILKPVDPALKQYYEGQIDDALEAGDQKSSHVLN